MKHTVNTREGDFIETQDGSFFEVKGLIHPPSKIVCFPRYIPDDNGDRTRKSVSYRKVYHLSERYELLRQRFPEYLVFDEVFGELLCEVPVADVKKLHRPEERLSELRRSRKLNRLEKNATAFLRLLHKHGGIPWRKLGVSGSLLMELHLGESDIDPVVYGIDNCWKAYATLEVLFRSDDSPVRAYNTGELHALFDFRSKDSKASFEVFLRTEKRKFFQGKFKQHDFFVRFVKDLNEVEEVYGSTHYVNVGSARVKAVVTDDSESIFTPCKYKIGDVEIIDGKHDQSISEIVSFRGRFCDQAKRGETVVAQGKIEKVICKDGCHRYRILVGNRPSDTFYPEL